MWYRYIVGGISSRSSIPKLSPPFTRISSSRLLPYLFSPPTPLYATHNPRTFSHLPICSYPPTPLSSPSPSPSHLFSLLLRSWLFLSFLSSLKGRGGAPPPPPPPAQQATTPTFSLINPFNSTGYVWGILGNTRSILKSEANMLAAALRANYPKMFSSMICKYISIKFIFSNNTIINHNHK
jgi:hypothetical protein